MLALDPDTAEGLRELDGNVVRLVVLPPTSSSGAAPAGATPADTASGGGIELALAIVDGRVDVYGTFDGQADVGISGPLSGLASLARGNDALYRGEVRIEGDVGVASRLSDVIKRLDLDLEEIVAPVLGGTLARRVGRTGRDAGAWARRTRAGFRDNVREYLQEESELLPTAGEIERFAGDVDVLRSDADRLEARIRRLERARDARVASAAEPGGTGSAEHDDR